MSRNQNISDAEWKVMQVLWSKSPLSSAQIIAELAAEDWHANTIKTFLSRLVTKGVVGVKKQTNRTYLYHPVVSQTQGVRLESQSFLDKVFDGDAKSLLVHFVERQKLSASDVTELKAILKRKQK